VAGFARTSLPPKISPKLPESVVCKDPFAVHADPKVGIILLPILQRLYAPQDLRVLSRRVLT